MARRRIRLDYITNESKRKASYQKRKNGMLKKLNELTVLCGVEAATIMYSSFEQQPVVWPSVEGVQQTITRFLNMPIVEQTRRMLNQESFIQNRLQKLNKQLLKHQRENRDKEITILMYQILEGEQTIDSLSLMDRNDLNLVIKKYLAEIDSKVDASTFGPPPPPLTQVPTMDPLLSYVPSVSTASTPVLGWTFPQNETNINSGTSNLVAHTGMSFQQNSQGNMDIQAPTFPNSNSGVSWSSERWARLMRMMNNNNLNYPSHGMPGTSSSNNP